MRRGHPFPVPFGRRRLFACLFVLQYLVSVRRCKSLAHCLYCGYFDREFTGQIDVQRPVMWYKMIRGVLVSYSLATALCTIGWVLPMRWASEGIHASQSGLGLRAAMAAARSEGMMGTAPVQREAPGCKVACLRTHTGRES